MIPGQTTSLIIEVYRASQRSGNFMSSIFRIMIVTETERKLSEIGMGPV